MHMRVLTAFYMAFYVQTLFVGSPTQLSVAERFPLPSDAGTHWLVLPASLQTEPATSPYALCLRVWLECMPCFGDQGLPLYFQDRVSVSFFI